MSKIVKKLVKNSNHALFVGLHLLSARKRHAMYSIYAYGKHLDDIASSSASLPQKLELFDEWRTEIGNIFDRARPTSDVGSTMWKNLRDFHLNRDDFLLALDSKKSELLRHIVAPKWAEYYAFCDAQCASFLRSALRILGCSDPQIAADLARSWGIALQTTIVLRDLKDAAMEGSLYIPADCLQQAGVSLTSPLEALSDNNLAVARGQLAKVAAENYDHALAIIAGLPRKLAARLKSFVYIYQYCFKVMENRGWEVITPKPCADGFTKLRLACKAYLGK